MASPVAAVHVWMASIRVWRNAQTCGGWGGVDDTGDCSTGLAVGVAGLCLVGFDLMRDWKKCSSSVPRTNTFQRKGCLCVLWAQVSGLFRSNWAKTFKGSGSQNTPLQPLARTSGWRGVFALLAQTRSCRSSAPCLNEGELQPATLKLLR